MLLINNIIINLYNIVLAIYLYNLMIRIVQESHANLICAEQPIMIDNARGIGYAITRKRRSFASMLQYYGRPGRLYKEKIDSPLLSPKQISSRHAD